MEWLGLPTDEWARYSFQHRTVLSAPKGSPDYVKATEVDLPYLTKQAKDVIAERAQRPTDDVISFLLAQTFDDRPLSQEEVYSMVELLLAGGTVTTSSLVSQALVWLYQHPDVRQRLIDEPELRTKAVEEFLRYFSPTQALARTVTRDVEFHGCPMRRATARCWPGPRPTGTRPAASTTLTRWTSSAGPTGTSPSASASTAASVRTSPGRSRSR